MYKKNKDSIKELQEIKKNTDVFYYFIIIFGKGVTQLIIVNKNDLELDYQNGNYLSGMIF